MTLDELREEVEVGFDVGDVCYYDGKRKERSVVLAFIRKQATKGTADYEHKLTKLADAIERGEHEC